MKMQLLVVALGSIPLLCASSGHCMDRGQTELSIDASLNVSNAGGVSHTTAVVNPRIGYFVHEDFEVGVGGNLIENSGAEWAAYGFAAKHFQMDDELGSALWFVGTELGGEFGEEGNGVLVGVFGGIKLLVPKGGGALFVQPFFIRTLMSADSFSEFGIATGVSIFF